MVYQSYDNNKYKIEKNWNRVEDNKNDLNNIPITNLNFNSINFNKKIVTIPIIDNVVTPWDYTENIQTILLENFPEDMLNMIEPTVIYSIDNGFISNFQQADITPNINNVYINNQSWKYWFNRIDKKHFLLKIFYTIDIRQKISPFPYYQGVPTTVNMSLKIYNQRIYETTNEKFE